MDHGIHGLDTCFQYPNLGLRFGWGPFPHLVWECRRCFHGDRVCHTATKSQALSLHYLNGYNPECRSAMAPTRGRNAEACNDTGMPRRSATGNTQSRLPSSGQVSDCGSEK